MLSPYQSTEESEIHLLVVKGHKRWPFMFAPLSTRGLILKGNVIKVQGKKKSSRYTDQNGCF